MKSGLTPRFLNCQWATKPAEMKARAIMTPNEFTVKPPIWNSSGYIQLLCVASAPCPNAPGGAALGTLSHADGRRLVSTGARGGRDRTGPAR